MAKADTSVKWFRSSMQGLGSFGATAGSRLPTLKQMLRDGFNSLQLTSLVVSGNIATATRSSGHGYEAKQVVEISGASPSSLNGEWRIATVDGNSFTFVTEGISDQTATGTIMCKVASAGWTSPISDGTNIAGFKSPSGGKQIPERIHRSEPFQRKRFYRSRGQQDLLSFLSGSEWRLLWVLWLWRVQFFYARRHR